METRMVIKSLYLSQELTDKILEQAKRESRTWSDFVRLVLTEYLKNLPPNIIAK